MPVCHPWKLISSTLVWCLGLQNTVTIATMVVVIFGWMPGSFPGKMEVSMSGTLSPRGSIFGATSHYCHHWYALFPACPPTKRPHSAQMFMILFMMVCACRSCSAGSSSSASVCVAMVAFLTGGTGLRRPAHTVGRARSRSLLTTSFHLVMTINVSKQSKKDRFSLPF